jgi:hypothetical protein
VKLIVELDDATDADRLTRILAALAAHRPYVRAGLVVVSGTDSDGDYAAAGIGGGGLGTEWW